jgi:hypothetical protein
MSEEMILITYLGVTPYLVIHKGEDVTTTEIPESMEHILEEFGSAQYDREQDFLADLRKRLGV